jgi:hypothetical protein
MELENHWPILVAQLFVIHWHVKMDASTNQFVKICIFFLRNVHFSETVHDLLSLTGEIP